MSTNNRRLTNEIVDNKLINDKKLIKRIGNYVNAHTKIDWQCIICNHIWGAIPNNILRINASGCPVCFGSIKYTNSDIDVILKNRNILRTGNYINYDTKIQWKCVKCEHEWNASPNNVVGKQSGCPVCSRILSGKSKSLGQKRRALEILNIKNIKITGEYIKLNHRYSLKCKECKHTWVTNLNSVVNGGTGCPSCVGLVKLSNEVVDKRLLEQGSELYRNSDIINARTKCSWRCEHGHTWSAVPDSVLNFGSGCPYCNKSGLYNESYIQNNPEKILKSANLYLVKITHKHLNESFIKIGITKNKVSTRFSSYKKKYTVETLHISQHNLLDCINLEKYFIQTFSKYQYIPIGKFFGKTECFIDTPKVEESILNLLLDI